MARGFIFTVAVCAWLLCEATAVGQGGGMGGGMGGMGGGGGGRGGMGGSRGSDRQNAPSNYYRGKAPPPPQLISTPHGGEYLHIDTNRYEIVYMPLQARIYLFDKDFKPLSARDVHARMSPKDAPQPIPFQYVTLPAGTTEQDYVVAAFDFQQLPDKDTPITFEFSGLPDRHKFLGIWDRHEGTASFTPIFSPSKIRPYVARVLLTEADREEVMRRRVCPVSGQLLGTKGPVIKLYIADYPLYLAGQDYVEAVNEAPEKYLPHPATLMSAR
jgi:hypothetical protein